jgi:hypothetical protein
MSTDSKSAVDTLRDSGFYLDNMSECWLNRDLRKSFSYQVVRAYQKHSSWLKARIEEPVPVGRFYFYRQNRLSSSSQPHDFYQKILIRLDLAQLTPAVRAGGKS